MLNHFQGVSSLCECVNKAAARRGKGIAGKSVGSWLKGGACTVRTGAVGYVEGACGNTSSSIKQCFQCRDFYITIHWGLPWLWLAKKKRKKKRCELKLCKASVDFRLNVDVGALRHCRWRQAKHPFVQLQINKSTHRCALYGRNNATRVKCRILLF